MRDQLFHDRVTVKQRPTRQQVVQRTSERINVASCICLLRVHRLFGGHVLDRPHDRAGRSQTRSLRRASHRVIDPRQAHVENLHGSLGIQQQIGGLDVAMNNSLLVRVLQSPRCLNNVSNRLVDGEWAVLFDEYRKVTPFDVLHHQEVRSLRHIRIVGGDNVGMAQLCSRFNFAMESLQRIRRLDCRR